MYQPINNSDFSWLVMSDYWEEQGHPFVEEMREEIRDDTVIDTWHYQYPNNGRVGGGRSVGGGIGGRSVGGLVGGGGLGGGLGGGSVGVGGAVG